MIGGFGNLISKGISGAKNLLKDQLEQATHRETLGNPRTLAYAPSSDGEIMGWITYQVYTHPVGGTQNPAHDASDTIHLHMPHQLESKVDTSWEDGTGLGAFRSMGADIADAIGMHKGGDKTGALNKVMQSAGQNAKELAPSIIANVAGSVMDNSNIIKAVTGVDGDALKKGTQKIFGLVQNPHEEMFFSNVEMREFSFQHKLIAFDESDTNEIDRIVNTFKYYASPGLTEKKRAMTYPAQFQVLFNIQQGDVVKQNPYLPKLKRCALVSVEVNHAASDGWAVHHNGAPADIDLTLSFKELAPNFKDHYKDRALGS